MGNKWEKYSGEQLVERLETFAVMLASFYEEKRFEEIQEIKEEIIRRMKIQKLNFFAE